MAPVGRLGVLEVEGMSGVEKRSPAELEVAAGGESGRRRMDEVEMVRELIGLRGLKIR